ncbi:MAG: hypothetical protein H3C34_08790 [Caldilineaceae bacterium]|nr:hypothetical protein [Caldilineaceae bacterium]
MNAADWTMVIVINVLIFGPIIVASLLSMKKPKDWLNMVGEGVLGIVGGLVGIAIAAALIPTFAQGDISAAVIVACVPIPGILIAAGAGVAGLFMIMYGIRRFVGALLRRAQGDRHYHA